MREPTATNQCWVCPQALQLSDDNVSNLMSLLKSVFTLYVGAGFTFALDFYGGIGKTVELDFIQRVGQDIDGF